MLKPAQLPQPEPQGDKVNPQRVIEELLDQIKELSLQKAVDRALIANLKEKLDDNSN